MKAIIATRFSDPKQIGNTSTETQLEACETFCKANGYEVIGRHIVEAESAKGTNLTRIAELLEFCAKYKNKADVLVVFKLDRLARDSATHYYIKSELIKLGIALKSATEPIDDTPTGQLMETVLAGIAQFDNSIKRERVKLAMKHQVENGVWPWQAPFGYKNVKRENGKAGIPKRIRRLIGH